MPSHLKRYQREGDDHFLTFSCHGCNAYLCTPKVRDCFLEVLERARANYEFAVFRYVVMPEHVHLLVGEPREKALSSALQALKLSMSKLSEPRPFWMTRYHDFNVFTYRKRTEKLHYMHFNPVVRGLVCSPEQWRWSTYNYYASDVLGPVQITEPT